MPEPTSPSPQDLMGVDDSKIFAAMSYLGVLALVPLIVRKRDPFVYFHLKQGLVLLLGFILAGITVVWADVIGSLFFLLLLLADVIGLLQALQGRMWKIPGIGQIASRFTI